MNRPITGFRLDDHGDWTALLSCGHAQHVRHTPPFTNRPWVTTAAGRDSRLGEPLPCVRCDRFELPERVVAYQRTPVFTESSIPASLRGCRSERASTPSRPSAPTRSAVCAPAHRCQAARLMLDRAGLRHVGIGRSHGLLSDHYNPATRRLALSKDVHDSTSIAAIGVATHEAGHAIQHAAHYAPLWLRSTLVPTANVGSSIGYVVMMIGLFMASQSLVGIGALTYVAAVISTLLTLLYFLMRASFLGGRDD